MGSANEVSALILWILFGIFLTHVIVGSGTSWLKSFFSRSDGTNSNQTASASLSNITGAIQNIANGASAAVGSVGSTPLPKDRSAKTGAP